MNDTTCYESNAVALQPRFFDRLQLFFLGFLGLFLELIFIRYLPVKIIYLGYFPNFVLLATFIGMGLGFLLYRKSTRDQANAWSLLVSWLLAIIVLLASSVIPVVPGMQVYGTELGGELFYTVGISDTGVLAYVLFFVLFLLLVLLFAAITQRTARVFSLFSPLTAYSLDIGGSLLGIIAFATFSYFSIGPVVWFLIAVVVVYFVIRDTENLPIAKARVPLLTLAVFVMSFTFTDNKYYEVAKTLVHSFWSPYQNVRFIQSAEGEKDIYVNGILHQLILGRDKLENSFYANPYHNRIKKALPPYRRVLIIGAGSGNDVAMALLNGAEHVDAVEIDPVIASIGKQSNSLAPYSDPRVNLIVDDGRSVLTRSKGKYDLIIYALTDSLVKVGTQSQLRLENYLYTQESFKRAYELLSDTGEIVLYNYYRQSWFAERLTDNLRVATGREPELLFQSGTFYQFVVGKVSPVTSVNVDETNLAVDNWPFPYVRNKGIPAMYIIAAGATFLLCLFLGLFVRKGTRGPSLSTCACFFFMGAAFLLLETKSVVQFSLLYGTTWYNSSIVFTAVLLLVLIANALVRVLPQRVLGFIPILLLLSCFSSWCYPLSQFLYLEDPIQRLALASLLTFLPIFFANLYFGMKFKNQALSDQVFGWNLFGAGVGGVIEYASMAIGYQALAIVIASLYAAAIVCGSWSSRE